MVKDKNKIIVFENKKIRHTWHKGDWWFSVVDVVGVLTGSINVKDYVRKMRTRDEELSKGWGQIVTPLSIETGGGKQLINCANKQGIFRIVQSIPSKKAEPFKLWLAKVGSERIDEIENPELAQKRMKEIYKEKGYSSEWIEKRVRGIAVRNELTDEWKNRGVQDDVGFAVLTNEISKATFGKTINEYKKHKNLTRQNLRDHMDDIELIFGMLGEATTTRLTRERDSKQFPKLKTDAKDGGKIAGNARVDFEKILGKSIVSKDNYLDVKKKKKKLIKL